MRPELLTPLKNYGFIGILIIITGLIQLNAPESTLLLRYQGDALQQSECWRFFTANLTHSGWNHWLLNMAGLVLIDYLFQPFVKPMLRAGLMLFCMLLNILLLEWMLNLTWYVGLSGALHGYLVGLALLSFKTARISNALILAGVTIKLFAELNFEINQVTAQFINSNVVEEAHLYGSISAVIFWLGFLAVRKIGKKS